MGMSQIWVSPNWMICYMDQHLFLLGLKFWLIGVMATTLESNIWQERILHSKTFFPLKPHEHVVFKCFSYLFIFSSEFLLSKPQWLFRLSIAMAIFLRLGIAQILSGQGAQSLCHGVDLFGDASRGVGWVMDDLPVKNGGFPHLCWTILGIPALYFINKI